MGRTRTAIAALIAALACNAPCLAQTYFDDFNDNNLVGPRLHGDAAIDGGSLRLTTLNTTRAGSIVVGGGRIAAFDTSFTYFFNTPVIGQTADGMSFNLGRVPDGIDPSIPWENGPGNGLTISFDIYDFDNDGIVLNDYGIRLFVNGTMIAQAPGAMLFTDEGQFRAITIRLDADGTIDVTYRGNPVFTNLATGYVPDASHRFSIAARTGVERSEQRIDNLSIAATALSEDLCRNAAPAHGDGVFWFDTTGATLDGSAPGTCPNPDNDVWMCWTAPSTGAVVMSTLGLTTVDTLLAAYNDCAACPSGLGLIDCHDDFSSNRQSIINIRVVAGRRYLVRVGSFLVIPGGRGAVSFQSFPDCPGDFNHSGGAPSVQDLFDFLAAFFAGCP